MYKPEMWRLCAGRTKLRGSVCRIASRRFAPQAAASDYSSSGGVKSNPRLCIVGGGFGGLYTALKLESLLWPQGTKPQIVLFDQRDRFVFKPLLYELINSTAQDSEVAPSFQQLLAPYAVEFKQAKVTGVEPFPEGSPEGPGGNLTLEDGGVVSYDYLVVALGSEADPRGVPGVKEHAVAFNSFEDALQVKSKLDELVEATDRVPLVMIVGAGYSGVELAAVIAERAAGRIRVQVVTPGYDVLESSPVGQREVGRQVLEDLGVEIMTGQKVKGVSRVESSNGTEYGPADQRLVQLEGIDGQQQEVSADLVVWTAGAAPGKLQRSLPFPTNERGAVKTEPSLQVVGFPNVYAVGDVAITQTDDKDLGPWPATAQVAFQQADYAAWNLWSTVNGRPQLPFRYQHLGNMMSLGQLNASVALPVDLPPPLKSTLQESPIAPLLNIVGLELGSSQGVTLQGPLAAVVRRAAYLYRQPTNEQRLQVAASWVEQASRIAMDVGQGVLQGVLQPSRSSAR